MGVASHLLHVEEHEGGDEDDKREERRVEKSKPGTETNKIMKTIAPKFKQKTLVQRLLIKKN